MKPKYIRLVVFSIIAFLFGYSLRSPSVYPWSGNWNTLSEDGTAEIQELNASKIYTSEVYWNNENRTILLSGQNATGATAYVGFDSNLDYLPNYWLCDSVADDVQINLAMDYVNGLGGGRVFANYGDYYISSPINVYGNILFEGASLEGTHFQLSNAANCDMFLYNGSDSLFFFGLINIYLHGNDAQNTQGSGVKILNDGGGSLVDGYIENVLIRNFKEYGIYIETGWDWQIRHSIIETNTLDGVRFWGSHIIFSDNFVYYNRDDGFQTSSQVLKINNNIFYQNYKCGLLIQGNADDSTIECNVFKDNNQIAGTYVGLWLNTADNNIITGNLFDGANKEKYGIEIASGSDNNYIKNNKFRNHVTAPIKDSGTNNQFHTLTLSFIDGTQFNSTDGEPWGWQIDAGGEYASTIGTLPLEVQQVIRWKIWATSLVTEADAMRLEIVGRGGASNEIFTTESVDIANKASTTTNFALDDIIYWTLTSSDDADLDDFLGGDAIMIKILHEAASGADCATNATFLCIEIEYV